MNFFFESFPAYGYSFQSDLTFPNLDTISKEPDYFLKQKDLFNSGPQPGSHSLCLTQAQKRSLSFYFKEDLFFDVGEVCRFYSQPGDSNLYYSPFKKSTEEQIRYWFLHCLFPLHLLLERKMELLHAGAVEIESEAVVFLARSCGGKSTLLHQFEQEGYSIITDDRLGIENEGERYLAVPSVPFLRPDRTPESLGKKLDSFCLEKKPVRSLFVLVPSGPDCSPTTEKLNRSEAFWELSRHWDFYLPRRARERFLFFGAMIKKIPVFRLYVPWNRSKLPEVVETVRLCLRREAKCSATPISV